MKEEQKELERIENRLQELRMEWSKASPAMKRYIEAGAKIYKDRKDFLIKKIEEEEKNGATNLF